VWAAHAAGKLTWDEAAARDQKLRRRQRAVVTPFVRRPGALAWIIRG
jgi:hypothetical protein